MAVQTNQDAIQTANTHTFHTMWRWAQDGSDSRPSPMLWWKNRMNGKNTFSNRRFTTLHYRNNQVIWVIVMILRSFWVVRQPFNAGSLVHCWNNTQCSAHLMDLHVNVGLIFYWLYHLFMAKKEINLIEPFASCQLFPHISHKLRGANMQQSNFSSFTEAIFDSHTTATSSRIFQQTFTFCREFFDFLRWFYSQNDCWQASSLHSHQNRMHVI